MRIGIVLHATPVYSETFFQNKIIFLKKAGFDIKLYVDSKHKGFHLCKSVKGFSVQDERFKQFVYLLHACLRLLSSPIRAVNLWKANKKAGFNFKQNALSLILSAHILGSNLDWLHFGFATTAVNRENLARIIGAKMAVSIRGFDINVYPLKNNEVYNLLWKRIDKLHYIGDGLLNKAIDLGFSKNITTQKITPAIDVHLFKFCERKNRFDEVDFTFTTLARLNWIKGLNYVLDALRILKVKGYNFQYKIIGEGPEFENLLFTREQLDLNNEVVFTGKLSHDKIKQELKETDIYIQYSIEEGFCNAVLEAQAMGCLCVVSDAEGLRENVLDGITGFVVEKRNPILLAEKLIEVLLMSENRKITLRNSAIKRIIEEFNLEKQKTAFIEFYNF